MRFTCVNVPLPLDHLSAVILFGGTLPHTRNVTLSCVCERVLLQRGHLELGHTLWEQIKGCEELEEQLEVLPTQSFTQSQIYLNNCLTESSPHCASSTVLFEVLHLLCSA